jgi:hypothetical protein
VIARFAKAVALFTLLTAVMTWPQVAHLGTEASHHEDVFFNMWRLGWVAHALATSPARVLDGNIFYPEPRTLTYSDAMPVESIVATPLLWAGVQPVLVHNLMLLGGIVLSAAGMFVLAASLTGSTAAGVTAGIVFAFVPYRFDHYMHLELQWTVWIPWAFWALHKMFDSGSLGDAALLGLFTALQFMSSVYYGIFLCTLLAVCTLLLLCGRQRHEIASRARALATAGIVAALLIAPYVVPYAITRQSVGPRPEEQLGMFSARPSSYRAVTETNYLYGERSLRLGRPERRLFPGVLPLLLAVVGLLLVSASDEMIMYLVGLTLAFEMSFGLKSYVFTFLYHHVPAFDGLRAPARLGIFVIFFLAVLAANGQAVLQQAISRHARPFVSVGIAGILLLEYWVAPLPLTRYPSSPAPVYAWLATQPTGVVAEFPIPEPTTLPGNEPRYAYMSTFHFMPLLNGYSGYYPASYLARLDRLNDMPDDAALQTLVGAGVRYVIIHTAFYRPAVAHEIVAVLEAHSQFRELGRFEDGFGIAAVFAAR